MRYSEAMTTFQTAVAGAIRVQLTRLGMSQSGLASAIQMHPASLSARLSGRTPIDVAEIDAIATALGLADAFELINLAAAEVAAAA